MDWQRCSRCWVGRMRYVCVQRCGPGSRQQGEIKPGQSHRHRGNKPLLLPGATSSTSDLNYPFTGAGPPHTHVGGEFSGEHLSGNMDEDTEMRELQGPAFHPLRLLKCICGWRLPDTLPPSCFHSQWSARIHLAFSVLPCCLMVHFYLQDGSL